MVCTALETLVAITISTKVDFSAYQPKPLNMVNISKGESMTVSFLVDPDVTIRKGVADPTIVVHDGTAPYEVCPDSFALTFTSGMKATLGAPTVDPETGVVAGFYFTLNQGRPVNDAAWLSSDAVAPGAVGLPMEESVGVPLTLTGQTALGQFRPSKFQGNFELRFPRGTITDLDITKSFGTYGPELLDGAKIQITRDWVTNIVISAKLESMKIGPNKA